MDDNLYPTSGDYFTLETPKAQEDASKNEENEVNAALPLIEEMITRLDSRIKFYKSIDAISDASLNEKDFMNTVASNKQTATALVQERDFLRQLIDAYVKKLT